MNNRIHFFDMSVGTFASGLVLGCALGCVLFGIIRMDDFSSNTEQLSSELSSSSVAVGDGDGTVDYSQKEMEIKHLPVCNKVFDKIKGYSRMNVEQIEGELKRINKKYNTKEEIFISSEDDALDIISLYYLAHKWTRRAPRGALEFKEFRFFEKKMSILSEFEKSGYRVWDIMVDCGSRDQGHELSGTGETLTPAPAQ